MSCWTLNFINFERIQQINLIFSFLTLNMYLPVRHRIKLAKQFKCTLNNRAVSLKHIHVAGVTQHGLNNQWTIQSNVHMILVTRLWVGAGWDDWKFWGGPGTRWWVPDMNATGQIWGPGADNLNTLWKFLHFLKCIDKLRVKNFMRNYEKQIQINLQKKPSGARTYLAKNGERQL